MKIEVGKGLMDVITSYGELEWGHLGPVITDSFPSVSPPVVAWRFKSPIDTVEQGIQTAIKSYIGDVKWDISYGGRHWVICPVKLREFEEQHKGEGSAQLAAAFGDANTDFCWEAIRDIPRLAAYVKMVVDALILQS